MADPHRPAALGRAALALGCALLSHTAPAAPLAAAPNVPTAQTAPAAPAAPTPGAELPPLLEVPEPDLSRLEPNIVRQIGGLSDLVRQLLEEGGDRDRLASAFSALGHLYVYYDTPEAALSCYENSRRLAPGDHRWPYYLGFVASDLGEAERAVEHFAEALGLAPGDLATLVRLGNLELDLDRPGEAEGHFRRAVEIEPTLAAGWYGLGRVAARRGDDAAAVELFRRTLDLQPEATLVHYALGQAYRRLGDLDRARESLGRRGTQKVSFPDPLVDRLSDTTVISSVGLVRALAADRERFADLRFLSYTMAFLSKVDGAIEHLIKELADWPEEQREADRVQRARLHYALGGLLVHRDRGAEAMEHYRRALDLLPDLDDARVKLANELARERDFEEATRQLTAVLERDPDNHAARLKRGATLMALERWEEAAEDLLALERGDPTSYEVRFRLAVSLERLGRPAEALPRYLAAAELETSDERAARAFFQAGVLQIQGGDEAAATRSFQGAVDRFPTLDGRLTLGGLLIRAQRYEPALEQFEAALAEHPREIQPHVGRATALLLLGRYGAAARGLEESLRALPGSFALALLLARVLAASPDPAVVDGARALALARQLDAAGPSPRTAETLAMAAAASGRFDEAVEWQRQAVERARSAGQGRLAEYFQARVPLYEAGRPWRAGGPAELIVLPGEG